MTDTLRIYSTASIVGTPPPGTVGRPYTYAYGVEGLPASKGTASGDLPPGLTLSPSGTLSGTPTAPGSYSFQAVATNDLGIRRRPEHRHGRPEPGAHHLREARCGRGRRAVQLYVRTHGVPAPTESVTAGTLPPGLTLSPAGKLSGTPKVAGTYSFTVTARNSAGSARQAVSVTVRPLPVLSIGNARTSEGNRGTKALTFAITQSRVSSVPVTVRWNTANGTAVTTSEYRAVSGTHTIPAGTTLAHVTVQIVGDRTREPDQRFSVLLRSPTKAAISRASAIGTIVNDD